MIKPTSLQSCLIAVISPCSQVSVGLSFPCAFRVRLPLTWMNSACADQVSPWGRCIGPDTASRWVTHVHQEGITQTAQRPSFSLSASPWSPSSPLWLDPSLFSTAILNIFPLNFKLFILYWGIGDVNTVTISGVQRMDSVIHMKASILSQTLLPSRLPRNTERIPCAAQLAVCAWLSWTPWLYLTPAS